MQSSLDYKNHDKESSWIAQELNRSIDSMIKNLRYLLENQSNQSINKSHFLCWRLNLTSYIFLLQLSSIVICLILFQTILIMFNHSFTEECSEEFRNHFSQISDADSLKSSSAASFIHEDDESFIETIIFFVFYKIWKTQSLALDEETNQLYKLNKQQEDKIKELKTKL